MSRSIVSRPTWAVLLVLLPVCTFATPYWTPEQIREDYEARQSTDPQHITLPPQSRGELDDHEYPVEYMQILDWLPTMQYLQPDENYGGMMEGEQDLTIIQTDNTQEALRDWARYALRTGDLERYQDNIDAAWQYIMEWPAYDEEGGGNPNYYRVHNCGWGLVAVMEYTTAYGDSSYLWYGDSCAVYLDTYRLSWNNATINTAAQSAGFGAGTLYMYGRWRENQDWIDAAQEIALDCKEYIDYDPFNRLSAAELWAMCGGTVMWGVCTALYLDDPASGEDWIETVIPYMDTYAGPGTWNNSWTIWYGFAWHRVHQILGEEAYLDSAIVCVENLLDQDDIDDDGGVPATEGQYDNDQSWTSAYLVWYGIEPLLEDIEYDLAATAFQLPSDSLPVPRRARRDVSVRVSNLGLSTIAGGVVVIECSDTVLTDSVTLERGEVADLFFPNAYHPEDAGLDTLLLHVNHPDDLNPDNDSLMLVLPILESGTLDITTIGDGAGEAIPSRVVVTHISHPDPYSLDTLQLIEGNMDVYVGMGDHTVEVIPAAPPYLHPPLDTVTVEENRITELTVTCEAADLAFISDANTDQYDSWIEASLDSLPLTSYTWSTDDSGSVRGSWLDYTEAVIWITGEDTVGEVFSSSNWNSINGYLQDGGRMLLSGQNLLNQWGGWSMLRTRFGAQTGSLDRTSNILVGDAAAPFMANDSLLVVGGGGGAGNQTAMDEIEPTYDSMPLMRFPDTGAPAAVALDNEQYGFKTVFCAFGLEGINSAAPPAYVHRDEFLNQTLMWFDVVDSDEYPSLYENALPRDVSIHTWPNPFNPDVHIEIALPTQQKAQLALYNLLGREVATWSPGVLPAGRHQFHWNGTGYASGMYFLRLRTAQQTLTNRVYLLR
ncbi:T9SS type A sorting domain-containing protein [bacterium]|nr:T9SS type A sorting domain-containing protein [bacterium]